MSRHDWNDHYATEDLPWDVGEPEEHLTAFVRSGRVNRGGRVLEVGCGTGTNALWLAGEGFDVVGIDVATRAIDRANTKRAAVSTPVACRFEVLDFLHAEPPGGLFDFIFDRGCFHVFHDAADRARFAERVAALLGPDGQWLSLIGSTEGPARDTGPPRRSAREVVEAIEPVLEIRELRALYFHARIPAPAAAWLCLAARRKVPAQPSTVG